MATKTVQRDDCFIVLNLHHKGPRRRPPYVVVTGTEPDAATDGLFRGLVRVLVPATSGNLGPGFDALGLAYNLYDQVEVQVTDGPTTIVVEGEGAGAVPVDETHLVMRALRRTLEFAGAAQPNLALRCINRIPHGRGLGSSAAAVVAGIMAARELLPDPESLTLDQVLALATEFEGHPDNAAPAIFGGATASWMDNGQPFAVRIPVSPDLRPILLVPNYSLATKAARAVLPAQVPYADAVFNIGRVALLTQALNSQPQYLFAATEDKLHQPYRAGVMPQSANLVAKLRAGQVPAVISGAGPTVLILDTGTGEVLDAEAGAEMLAELGKNLDFDPAGWRVLPLAVDEKGATATRELA